MESIDLMEIVNQINPNEKMFLEKLGNIKTYLCKCFGKYSPEYFYKQRIILILDGEIEFKINEKIHKSKKGEFILINSNENIEIINSNAILLSIFEEDK